MNCQMSNITVTYRDGRVAHRSSAGQHLRNRMCVSWKSFVLLLLLHAGLHGLAAAELCQHQGQCLGGNLLREYLTDSLESCITQGGQVEGAKFVTWKSTKVCQAFSYCQSVDVEAEAVTSSLDCKVRGKTGECVGQIYAVPGKADCKQLCEETPTCASFSYLEEQQYCLIFADCTTNCSTSMSCIQETSPTPSTATPTTSPIPSTTTPTTSPTPSTTTPATSPTPSTTAPETSPTPSTTTPATSPTTSAPAAMNKILYISRKTGKTTLVSLDGTTANCALEDYPADSNWPAAVTYTNGEVLACGGRDLEDADRCWSFNGSAWSSLPHSKQKHCWSDSPNVIVNEEWWITGRLQTGDYSCSSSSSTSDVYTGSNWKPGPALPGDEYPDWSCVVNLNTTHTSLIGGGYPTSTRDAWLYDWTSQAWTRTGSLIQGRYGHGCVALDGERILVAGGYDGSSLVYSAEIYDAIQGTWSSQPDLPADINPVAPILLNWDGQVLALFRDKDQIYQRSEETGEWSVLQGVQLPSSFGGYNLDKAVLVPGSWSCNPAQ